MLAVSETQSGCCLESNIYIYQFRSQSLHTVAYWYFSWNNRQTDNSESEEFSRNFKKCCSVGRNCRVVLFITRHGTYQSLTTRIRTPPPKKKNCVNSRSKCIKQTRKARSNEHSDNMGFGVDPLREIGIIFIIGFVLLEKVITNPHRAT